MNTLVVSLPAKSFNPPRWPAALLSKAARLAQWVKRSSQVEPLAYENAHILAVQALFATRSDRPKY